MIHWCGVFVQYAATRDTPSRGPRFQAGTFLLLISIKTMDAFFTCYLVIIISSVHFQKGLHNFQYKYYKRLILLWLHKGGCNSNVHNNCAVVNSYQNMIQSVWNLVHNRGHAWWHHVYPATPTYDITDLPVP